MVGCKHVDTPIHPKAAERKTQLSQSDTKIPMMEVLLIPYFLFQWA